MKIDHTERLFKWIDIIRWALYGLVAGAVGLAVWATKIQMTENDLEKRMNDMNQNSSIHRDALKEKETHTEHRISDIEQWVRDHHGNLP